MTLARQWRGDGPFEEVWFLEALVAPDRGVWLRWVLDATRGVGEVWALVLDRGAVKAAHRVQVPIAEVDGPLFEAGGVRLERDRAVGSCGPVAWDLRLDDRGARHAHVPLWVRFLGLGRTYAPAVLDLRVSGTLTVDGVTARVEPSPGVLGHLWGTGSRVRRWAWAHCNAFDREDLVFEALSAEVPLPGLGPRALTSVVLHADGHTYGFSRTRDLWRTWSSFGSDGRSWSFEARRDGRSLTGKATLRPERAARVRYQGPSGGTTCTNTRFGELRVVLRDPAHGVELDLRSRECAFELATPAGEGPWHLG